MENEKTKNRRWWNVFNRQSKIEKTQQEIENRHKAIDDLYVSSPFRGVTGVSELEAKNLVLTDLFVQKDVSILEKRAKLFIMLGFFLYVIALVTFAFAAFVAFVKVMTKSSEHIINIKDSFYLVDWSVPVQGFIISFTFYGLLILLGVTAWKQAKAYFDQAERLYSKRRINRFLRLYIHINNAKMTLDEMKDILALSESRNAFTDIKTEAKAPWGNVINDLIKSNTEIVKSMTQNTKDLTVKNKLFDYKKHK